MDIEIIDNNKIKINVSCEELTDYCVSYERLSSEDPDTRRMILGLLDIAKNKVGFEHKNKKLYIETFPDALGGCVLYFTVLTKNAQGTRDENSPGKIHLHCPVTFIVPDAGLLYDVAKYLSCRSIKKIIKSCLYLLDGKYALVIFPSANFESEPEFLSGEFMLKSVKGGSYLNYLKEHASPLIDSGAIEILLKS